MDGLAAAGLVMGEGAEQTPLAIVREVTFVHFSPCGPTVEELAALRIAPEDDLYAPLLTRVPWVG
jgi:F420-0:gamma-glutamyl ligase